MLKFKNNANRSLFCFFKGNSVLASSFLRIESFNFKNKVNERSLATYLSLDFYAMLE